ncbi:MAG: hypothetical protein ABJC26_15930 [Gemmatimonadaceae bacterium]
MISSLELIVPNRKSGDEPLHANGVSVGGSILDFWRWSASDLLSNATRGRFAEYIVHRAVSGTDNSVRAEWDAFDLTTPDGIRVEVKSAAYIQSWHQKRESAIAFLVPKTLAWSAATNQQETVAKRHANVYVFALLHERVEPDPLDVRHWTFYVVATGVLDARTRSQHSISLASLIKVAGSGVVFEDLARTIASVAKVV